MNNKQFDKPTHMLIKCDMSTKKDFAILCGSKGTTLSKAIRSYVNRCIKYKKVL